MRASGLEMVYEREVEGSCILSCLHVLRYLEWNVLCLMIIFGDGFCSYVLSDVATRYTRSPRRILVYRSLLHERIWIMGQSKFIIYTPVVEVRTPSIIAFKITILAISQFSSVPIFI